MVFPYVGVDGYFHMCDIWIVNQAEVAVSSHWVDLSFNYVSVQVSLSRFILLYLLVWVFGYFH